MQFFIIRSVHAAFIICSIFKINFQKGLFRYLKNSSFFSSIVRSTVTIPLKIR